MLNAREFLEVVRIKRKLERREALTATEQEFAKKYKVEGPKLCGHNGCIERLPPRVDGERHQIDGKEVCDDCYYRGLGDELERYPIASPGFVARHKLRRFAERNPPS